MRFCNTQSSPFPQEKRGIRSTTTLAPSSSRLRQKLTGPLSLFRELQRKLISFLLLMQAEDGKFHNLMDYSQRFIDSPTVGDHLGRAIWAAGSVINSDLPNGMKAPARVIFDRALPWARKSSSPRTLAYTCIGLCERFQVDS